MKELNVIFDKNMFHWTLTSGSRKCLEYLLEEGCPYGFLSLEELCSNSNIELLKLIHEKGKYINDKPENYSIYEYIKDLEILK